MKNAIKEKQRKASLRARRTRARIHGTAERPRMSVKRSLKHLYVQLINDDTGKTVAAASDHDIKEKGKPIEIAKAIGFLIAEKAKTTDITQVVFDRGSYRFHGRVAALVEGAREGGLKV